MITSRRSFCAALTGTAWMASRASAVTSTPAKPPVMVIGGTGRVGAFVVRRLLSAGIPVAFTTRNADNTVMFGPNARGVVVDINRREGLERVFAGYPAVLMVLAYTAEETAQGLNCISAMRQAGVQRVVFLSNSKPTPHYRYKIPIEQALAEWGVPGAILRPNYFYQYDLESRHQIVDEGVFPMPMGLIGVSRLDCRDIAQVAVRRLTAQRATHDDDELHGPEALTGPQIARLYQRALRKPVRYFRELPQAEQAHYAMTSERGRNIAAFWEGGLAKATPEQVALTRQLVGHPLRRFEDFVPEAVALWKSGKE